MCSSSSESVELSAAGIWKSFHLVTSQSVIEVREAKLQNVVLVSDLMRSVPYQGAVQSCYCLLANPITEFSVVGQCLKVESCSGQCPRACSSGQGSLDSVLDSDFRDNSV